ncbi:hypothetical protein [Micromonospora carbonacea]|uniref:hypothetical protein n=1 Tax=Micromonospora carbonacea TaxID=47853 RepID=UPI0037198FCF
MYDRLGFPIAGVEADVDPPPARPWDVLLRLAADDPAWRELAHPATLDVYARYRLDDLWCQPLHPNTLAALVHSLGVPTTAGRAAAIRQHVLDMPAPIVATALGYHHATTARLATEAAPPGPATPRATTDSESHDHPTVFSRQTGDG